MSHEDPRQVRTRRALGEALRRLLREQSLDEITVVMLCREAGVHRTTFYAHADDVHTFAVSYLTRSMDEASTVVLDEQVEGEAAGLQLTNALRGVFEHAVAERDLYRAMLASRSRGALRAALSARLRYRTLVALEALDVRGEEGIPATEAAREDAAAYMAGGLVGFLDLWIGEDDDDVDRAAVRVRVLMPGWWRYPL